MTSQFKSVCKLGLECNGHDSQAENVCLDYLTFSQSFLAWKLNGVSGQDLSCIFQAEGSGTPGPRPRQLCGCSSAPSWAGES